MRKGLTGARSLCAIALISGAVFGAAADARAAAPPPAGAVVSPDGKRAAWVGDGGKSVWNETRASASAEWRDPERLLAIRGTVGKLVFSPDSTQLAFENPRGDHAFIAVYDLKANKLGYADPSFGSDSAPSWSADGKQLSFVRSYGGAAVPVTAPAPSFGPWIQPPARTNDTFKVADILQAPISYGPEASGDGRSVAYITREATTRAIYFMRSGTPSRRVVNYPDDDGRELSQLAVSRAGGAIAYVRDSSPNSDGEILNPGSDVDTPHRLVYVVPSRAGVPRMLGDGLAPAFTPDDKTLVWVNGTSVMSVSLTYDSEGTLTSAGTAAPLFTVASGTPSNLRFSPDGSKLMYSRSNGVEVFDMATHTTAAVAHTGASDATPVWSPDGTQIAFRRTVSGQPWGLWVADAATLTPRQVWQASAGLGSSYYSLDQNPTFESQPGDQFFWSDDGTLAFVWEVDGWRHLYSVPAAGGVPATLLTPGDGEVESAEVARDHKSIVYATNIGEIGRRHLFSVGFHGGAPVAVTGGHPSQWAPMPLADGEVAYVEGSYNDPPTVFLRDAAGTISKGGPDLPESYPRDKLVEPTLVSFPSSIDHKTVAGQLFVPEHPTGCGLIFPHGGPSRQMLPGYHYYDTYTVLYEMNQYFASHGCVVLSVDYRGGIMYGNAWRTFPGRGGTSAAEYQDIQGGAAFLLAQPQVDPAKVGIYGLSYGGYLTTLGVSRNSDIFHVAWDMAGNSGNAAVANLASWTAPILIEQGDDDRNVDFSSNVSVVRAIKAQKPSLELATRVFPNEQHEMYMRFEDLVEAYDTGGQWMLAHLFPNQVSAPPLEVGGTVPATLSLTLGGTASFGPFTPGTAKDYSAQAAASVTSTAGDASLSVSDPGHLMNGTFALPEPLQVTFSKASWTGPATNDPVTIGFKQHINANDTLRTGTYGKTLTFTLSTTTP